MNRMSEGKNELIKILEQRIEECVSDGQKLSYANWEEKKGVLITINQAQNIMNLINQSALQNNSKTLEIESVNDDLTDRKKFLEDIIKRRDRDGKWLSKDPGDIDWDGEVGVLITVNQAKFLVTLLQSNNEQQENSKSLNTKSENNGGVISSIFKKFGL